MADRCTYCGGKVQTFPENPDSDYMHCPRASRDAERYIRTHGVGGEDQGPGHGLVLLEGTPAWNAPEWQAIRDHLWAWRTRATPPPAPGEQIDLFTTV